MATDAGSITPVARTGEPSILRAYRRLAPVYDWVFGAALEFGRREALRRLPLASGDRVLEVGVGTALTAPLYPPDCVVTGIDVSEPMLERAERRLAALGARHISLRRMDARSLDFEDESFALAYAAYTLSAVAEPERVVDEMCRVCRPGGHVVFLNHFRSRSPVVSRIERMFAPVAAQFGFSTELDMAHLLGSPSLRIESIHRVPPVWSLVICRKTGAVADC